jgi:fructose/tagatose bisphosphate aldolase
MGLLEPHERHRRGAGAAGLRRGARKPRGERPKALVVHSLGQALAALRAAGAARVPLVLMSGRGAAGYAGPAWFAGVMAEARARHPEVAVAAVLDCAEAPGRAVAALRLGWKTLRLGGGKAARARVAAIAKRMDARLDDTDYAVLDLGAAADAERAAREFLGSSP